MQGRPVGELIADRVAYWLTSRLRSRASARGDFKGIVVPIDDQIGWRVIATGRYELTHLDGVRTIIERPEIIGAAPIVGGTFIDIGANIGLYTIALSSYFAHTVAFEANSYTFKILQANVSLSDSPDIDCVCKAMSDHCGNATMDVALKGNLGWGRIAATPNPKHGVPVHLETLDDWIAECVPAKPVTLIKIDVEGHEPKVLSGCRKLLTTSAPVVLFEALDEAAGGQCLGLLRSCGYTRLFEFARRMPRGARLGEYAAAAWHGVPVDIREVPRIEPGRHALMCAVKPQ
jgi:FkbM family methyltransferase